MISILKIIAIVYVAIAIYGKGIEDGKAKFCQQSQGASITQTP